MRHTVFFLFFLLTISCIAQTPDDLKKNRREISLYLGGAYSPILSKNFGGLDNDWKYNIYKRLMIGLSFSSLTRSLETSFQYTIQKPILSLWESSFLTQWNLVRKNRFRLNLGVNNGLAIARLGDAAEINYVYTGKGVVAIPKKIAENYYYDLAPNMDISLKLKNVFWLTAKAKYRFLYGNSQFSNLHQFSNYMVSIGITIIE